LGAVAVVCVVFAPVVVHLLAPGFREAGERFPLAVEFVRLSVPYIMVAGLVAVAAATLNAEGRVGAAAFGLVVFNVVMIAAVAIAASQSRAFEIALALSLPAALAFALLAETIAGGLFERGAFGPHDTAAVAAALAAICAGLPGHTLENVLGAVSFAHEDTRTPMLAALAGLGTALTGAVILFPLYGHTGVAAAIAISGWVGAIL